ncbi:MAG: carboxynorspermidine decarboxylase, partial [Selenomonadaceae bacterium]|nr:carboxynorspermidine decarboxylase [Selenomonadaceae bacterium]
ASGLYEARLAHEEMGKENHIFSPAYREEEFDEIADICDHIIFNSFEQMETFGERARARGASCGLRLNPEHSTQEHEIYDPCAPGSRLGIPLRDFQHDKLDGVDGFHFHTLCEQDADALEETLKALEQKFGLYFKGRKWINLGGGHHITREGYRMEILKRCIARLQDKYGLEVYIEPGEAVALNAGFLVTKVLALQESAGNAINAILDTSAACHMPDVIEMPYRPPVVGAGEPGKKEFTYRFGGPTCLAGDIMGEYSFDAPLEIGDRVIFEDMAIYSMVKNNTFNGMPLPDIVVVENGEWKVLRHFGYEDFKGRL